MKKIIFIILAILFLVSGLAFAEQKGKICVATQEKNSEAPVSDKAALAPYLLIFDEKGNLVETIDNPFKEKKLEAGKLMADFLAEKGVTAIIGTDYCGDIIGILKNKGVTAYNFEGSAAEAVTKLVHGTLPEALQENTLVETHKVMKEAMRTGQEKIAVAANGDTPGAPVNAQAASSPYFLVFDQKGKLLEAIENPYKTSESPGPDVVNYLFGKGATVVVAGDFGPKIVEVMKAKRIWPVRFNGSAQDAVKKVLHSKMAK
jgi:predicted Fe-Mo cluster-binding NifX family protein